MDFLLLFLALAAIPAALLLFCLIAAGLFMAVLSIPAAIEKLAEKWGWSAWNG